MPTYTFVESVSRIHGMSNFNYISNFIDKENNKDIYMRENTLHIDNISLMNESLKISNIIRYVDTISPIDNIIFSNCKDALIYVDVPQERCNLITLVECESITFDTDYDMNISISDSMRTRIEGDTNVTLEKINNNFGLDVYGDSITFSDNIHSGDIDILMCNELYIHGGHECNMTLNFLVSTNISGYINKLFHSINYSNALQLGKLINHPLIPYHNFLLSLDTNKYFTLNNISNGTTISHNIDYSSFLNKIIVKNTLNHLLNG